MPIGKPTWYGDFKGYDLSEVFGFVEAYIYAPPDWNRPLLRYCCPYKGVRLFPTGNFFGVYFTEELKEAVKHGYRVDILKVYL